MRDALRRLMINACTCLEVGVVALGLLTVLAVGALGCSSPRTPERPAVDLRQDADQAAVLAAEAEAAVEVAPPGADGAELRALAAKLRARATSLDHLATEHQARAAADAREAEVARWRELCRWIALGCVLLGSLIAAGGVYARASLVVGAGSLVACVGLAVQAWGEALGVLTWLLPILAATGVIAAVVITARRKDAAAVLTGHLADAYEYGRDSLGRSAKEIKAILPVAQSRAGIKQLVDRSRSNRGRA